MVSAFKVLIITLLFAILSGCLGGGSGKDSDWRPDQDVVLEDVGWISQDAEGGMSSLNCGPASLLMGAAYLARETPTEEKMYDMMDWMDQNVPTYGGAGSYHQGSTTSRDELVDTSVAYLNQPAKSFGDDISSPINGLEDLYRELRDERPVVIWTYVQIRLGYEHSEEMTDSGDPHGMLLVGMTEEYVVFHDPAENSESSGAYVYFTIPSFMEFGWDDRMGVRFVD